MDQNALRAVLARDNKRGYLAGAHDEVPMVLLAGPGVAVRGASGLPLNSVPEKVVLGALNTVREMAW